MKKSFSFCLILFGFISACGTAKIESEFIEKKNTGEVALIFNTIKTVEKKKGLNVIFTKYLDEAPNDEKLLEILNQYTLYYLYEKGYKNIYYKDVPDDILTTEANLFEITWELFEIKEFKYKEYIEDSLSDAATSVKLKGIETSLKGNVYPIINDKIDLELEKKIKSSFKKSEEHEGEFGHSTNLRDVVVGNKNGSKKYLYNLNQLDDGIFENQCLLIAENIAYQIDLRVKQLYVKQLKNSK